MARRLSAEGRGVRALSRDPRKALGRPVQAQAIPRERWSATLESFKLAPGETGVYKEMMDGLDSGWIHFGVPGTERVAATTPSAQVFAQAT